MDAKLPETGEGTNPFAIDPIIVKQHYEIDYLHSYAQDSPFFAGLARQKLLGSRCTSCCYTYATPRSHCMECGGETSWVELPLDGRVHTFTTCHYSSEAFFKEIPFTLVLVEFDGVDTLLLSRLVGVPEDELTIGMSIRAEFVCAPTYSPTDVYFVPLQD